VIERSVLGLFAKWPRPGAVKTRLAEKYGLDRAARIAHAFLCDSLARYVGLAQRCVVVFDPPEQQADFAVLAREGWALLPQGEGDLGARLGRFFERELAAGAEGVIAVGADSPTLPTDDIEWAFITDLMQADVVLTPATDGGYCLLGCRRLPPVFDGIPWGSNRVLAETVARLRDPEWSLLVKRPWYDVDTPDDWQLLAGHVAALRRAGVDPRIPHTEALLRELPP
jgi:rSAM/selenodomain-associated transferase 1